jgi:hypothetical protein
LDDFRGASVVESLFRRVTKSCLKDDLRGKKNCDGLPFGFFARAELIY